MDSVQVCWVPVGPPALSRTGWASAHPSVHQLPDQEQPLRPPAGLGCLAVEGGHRAGHQRDIPQVLQLAVSGSDKDRRFPCSDAPSRMEVFAICGQQASLPFHLSTLRIGNITSRVHQAVTTRRSAVKAARCEAACLLRRLAHPCRYSQTGSTAGRDNHQCDPVSRLDHKLRVSDLTPSQDFQFLGMLFII